MTIISLHFFWDISYRVSQRHWQGSIIMLSFILRLAWTMRSDLKKLNSSIFPDSCQICLSPSFEWDGWIGRPKIWVNCSYFDYTHTLTCDTKIDYEHLSYKTYGPLSTGLKRSLKCNFVLVFWKHTFFGKVLLCFYTGRCFPILKWAQIYSHTPKITYEHLS